MSRLLQHRSVNCDARVWTVPWVTLISLVSKSSATGTKSRLDETGATTSELATRARLIMSIVMRTSALFRPILGVSAPQTGHSAIAAWHEGPTDGDCFLSLGTLDTLAAHQ